jgi:hypothetical protein
MRAIIYLIKAGADNVSITVRPDGSGAVRAIRVVNTKGREEGITLELSRAHIQKLAAYLLPAGVDPR